jgi:signal transduction histidine kinase
LTIVNPTTLKSDRAETPVRIEEITADDRGVEITPKAVLSAGTNRLQIGYSAIELTSVEKVRFRYRLDGFDAAWIEAGRQRQAVYTQLPARSYRFVVQATNHDGSWSEPGAVWQFAITPMFYETAWFATMVITSLALIGWATWRFHIRRVRQQFALVLSERVRMSRELHDTLLQSLVGVAVQVGTVADALESSSPARQQIIRIRERVEEYIRDARQSIWNLRAPVLASRDLSSSLRCVGERAIGERPIALEIATVGEPVKYASEVEEQLLRIGQEAILNAALHADPTRIHIALQYSDDSLRLSVSDDGGGFDVAHAFANADGHYGLITMKERAEAAGGRLDISSTPSTGTSVVVAVRYSPPDLE